MSKILETARMVLETESQAVARLIDSLDDRFEKAVEMMYACSGKIVVCGMGKSGIICKKIAATLSSIGQPAMFLHPGEAIHGDIGIVQRDDVVLAVSNSGETHEILRLVELVKRLGVPVIALAGRADSTLAGIADVAVPAGAEKEACPLDLLPTASTTAALAMGDALAVALGVKRGFGRTEFAAYHPGGSLGQRILRVEDLMRFGSEVPSVQASATMADAVEEMSRKGLGMVVVMEDDMSMAGLSMAGLIVDGDLRRLLRKGPGFLARRAGECCTPGPKSIPRHELASRAILLMQEHKITSLVVTEDDGGLAGVLHVHDVWKLRTS